MSDLPSREILLEMRKTMSLTEIAFRYDANIGTVAARIRAAQKPAGRKAKVKPAYSSSCRMCGTEIERGHFYCNECRLVHRNERRDGCKIKPALRKAILSRDNYTCFYCGAAVTVANAEIDHKLPFSRGGDTEPSNLVTSCHSCNWAKGDRTAEEYLHLPTVEVYEAKPTVTVSAESGKRPGWHAWVYGGCRRPR